MKYEEWPEFIRFRHALEKIVIGNGSTASSYVPDPSNENMKAREVVDWIYAVLTTFDSKASALMRLNGVLIAAAAFLLGQYGRAENLLSGKPIDALLTIGCALTSALSITCCLFVVNVSWNFLGRVSRSADGAIDCADELRSLEKARNFRQRMYRTAWAVSLFGASAFLLEFILQAIHVVIRFV